MIEDLKKQRELVLGMLRGDGSYYLGNTKYGRKELFRINTTSEILARQIREILLRLGIVASLNKQIREKPRRAMYILAIGGEFAFKFGELIGMRVQASLNGKKRATMFGYDGDFAYVPIKKITKRSVSNISVYNFSVKEDESYVAGGVAVHNCTAPVYSTDSLHSAVVEIFVKKNARCRYTTIQNWSSNVYNLVTKRAFVEEEGIMEWVDGNIGSKITMKYPSCYLVGRGARGEILSLALAGATQHQDAGGKLMFLAPDTSGEIISKSVSHSGGRTSYRGLVKVIKGAERVKCNVRCDALILDEKSRSDTYPTMQVDEDNVHIGHEAAVSKINAEQLFYLMSRGLSEIEATSLIVNGFIEPIVKELPLEYAVELNRLIQLNMEGAVG